MCIVRAARPPAHANMRCGVAVVMFGLHRRLRRGVGLGRASLSFLPSFHPRSLARLPIRLPVNKHLGNYPIQQSEGREGERVREREREREIDRERGRDGVERVGSVFRKGSHDIRSSFGRVENCFFPAVLGVRRVARSFTGAGGRGRGRGSHFVRALSRSRSPN